MTALRNTNFLFEVAKGKIAKHSNVFMVGANTDVGTANFETVWPLDGLITVQTSASTLNLSSADANDNSAGTGARTVLITGVGAGYVAQSETVIMNGQTPVATASTYIAINTMNVITAGTGLVNAGRIFASTGALTAGVPTTANVYNMMELGGSIQSCSIYTVPTGSTLFLSDVTVSINANLEALTQFMITANGVTTIGFPFAITNVVTAAVNSFAIFPATSFITSEAKAVSSACQIRASFSFVKVDD